MSMLRNIRERKGFSLPQLAARAGISARVLTDYEEGRQSIALPHAKLLAKALWVGIEELIPPAGTVLPVGQASSALHTPQGPTPTQLDSSPPPVQSAPSPATPLSDPQAELPPSGNEQTNKQHTQKQSRPPGAPTTSLTEGQVQELTHLAVRLRIDQAQLEERIGKSIASLKRVEAKDWIKRLRLMADEVAPSVKVRFGQWPESHEDREALYLREQKEAGVPFTFKLFNGDAFTGPITDFTPYTVTLRVDAQDMVLRKLAIAYYRRAGASMSNTSDQPSKEKAEDSTPAKHNHRRDDRHQKLDKGLDTDHTGSPDTPEEDNMDEDRGA